MSPLENLVTMLQLKKPSSNVQDILRAFKYKDFQQVLHWQNVLKPIRNVRTNLVAREDIFGASKTEV